jgi:amino acid adenylation domain-containing protein/thioester reductase-like protein
MRIDEESLVHNRFAALVAAHGETSAVHHQGGRTTYRQLDERANQLANHLRGLGIGRDSVVMVHQERSIDLIVSLLATFKAGAAYLPVDPGTPVHRMETFVKETGCAAVVTSRDNLAKFAGLPVLTLTPDAGAIAESPLTAPDNSAQESDTAYVIYTSGSTGTPKGVRVDHASLAYMCDQINERYGIGPDDRVLQFAAISFDTSIEQILVTLLNGATLVLPDHHWAPSELPEHLTRHRVTVMDLTPSYWRAFLSELDGDPVDLPVRLAIVGGSAVHADDCRTALRVLPNTRLVNAYGLTETTITSCTMEITPDVLPERGPAPVGKPLPHTSVYVLDDNQHPVPPREQGEIYISGPGVAQGYVVEDAPGHDRFMPDPFVGEAGTRMYRTGDTGRWTADGVLEVVGRVDRQLKVRGFRVEPAEIEAALATHVLIDDVAVKPYTHNGELQIAAFYTAPRARDRPLATRDLRAFLAHQLPAYMVPATFVELAEMPLKPNGKVDLAALPDPQHASTSAAVTPDGPQPASLLIERAVAGIWCQVLGVEEVRAPDNFFELGGNSILAAELLAKVRATLGILITQVRPLIRLLLEDATLSSFAAAVESARAGTLAGDPKVVDFAAEAVVGVPVQRAPAEQAAWQAPANILLTGASGFLGTYLLRELLDTTDATVHCVIRADGPDHAMDRIQANARHYYQDDLAEHRASGRIRAIPGDLAQPRLGLPEEDFDRLARTVDVIHHPGGLVNFIYPYSHMRPANVEGTREIIRLAGRYRNIPVHYISTMAVVSGFGTAGVRQVTEHTPAAHADRLSVGYVESKWVAEVLLRNAAEEGLPVAIYRAADISGDCRTGAWNTATEMCAMKKFIVDTGTSPIAELPLDYTPVDRYAAAVAHIAARRLPRGEIYHLTNPGKVNVAVLAERLRAHGHTVRDVPWAEWLDQVVKVAVEQPGHPMTPFAPLFIDRCSTGEMSVAEMYLETTFPVFTRENVDNALAGSGIEIPPVDADMLDRYIRYLTSIQFL